MSRERDFSRRPGAGTMAAVYRDELSVFSQDRIGDGAYRLAFLLQPAFWYAFLQLGVLVTFAITAFRPWGHSRARLIELITAFIFGLLLEQGDIFLFGTYRYGPNWILLGDVPVAIALTWAL